MTRVGDDERAVKPDARRWHDWFARRKVAVQKWIASWQRKWSERVDASPRLKFMVDLGQRIAKSQSGVRLSLAAAGAAFWLVIAIFPATIATVTIFGLVVDPQAIADAVDQITKDAPGSIGAVLAQQAAEVASADPSSLSIGLVISLAVTLWSVSSGSYGLSRAVRGAYGLAPEGYVRARFRAFLGGVVGVIVLGFLWLGCAAAGVYVSGLSLWPRVFALIVLIPVALLAQAAIYALQFRYSIASPTPKRCVLPGAALASAAIALLFVGLGIYASYAPDYQAIYGALTGVILAMLAIYAGVYALLLAAVFNAQLFPLPAVPAAPIERSPAAAGSLT